MLKGKRFAVFAIILLMAAVLLAMPAIKTAFAAAETDAETNEIALIVRPLVIINYSAVPGEKFDVSINITMVGAINVHGFSMGLSYDPNLIKCTTAEVGDFFQGFDTTLPSPAIDNAVGSVYASVNLTSSGATVDNNGTLVTLMFQVKGTGETSLHIYDVFLYDSVGMPLQNPTPTTYDGYFNNKFNFDPDNASDSSCCNIRFYASKFEDREQTQGSV